MTSLAAIDFHPPSGPRATERASGILSTENRNLAYRQGSVLDRLTEDERSRVTRLGRRRTHPPGSLLFTQGDEHDGIFLIESGRVRVFYSSPTGREITLAYWTSGNFVGGPDVFGGRPHVWSGVAVTEVRTLLLSGKLLRRLVVDVPALLIGLIEALSFKGKCYSGLAQILGTRSMSERLACLLLQLADLYGVPTGAGIRIDTSYTHLEIAQLIGATRQWVTIMLKRLQASGAIRYAQGIVTVTDMPQLRDLEIRD